MISLLGRSGVPTRLFQVLYPLAPGLCAILPPPSRTLGHSVVCLLVGMPSSPLDHSRALLVTQLRSEPLCNSHSNVVSFALALVGLPFFCCGRMPLAIRGVSLPTCLGLPPVFTCSIFPVAESCACWLGHPPIADRLRPTSATREVPAALRAPRCADRPVAFADSLKLLPIGHARTALRPK